MGRHVFNQSDLALIEEAQVPVAVYQFVDKRVVSLAISEGFCTLFEYDHDEVYHLMDTDMYRDTHPDDVARVSDAAFRFATQDDKYNVVYRTKTTEGYRIIHALGEHVYADDGARLAVIWYTDEGIYDPNSTGFESGLNHALNSLLHEETLFQASYYDDLTGLPNMTCFFELADGRRKGLKREGRQPAFLFTDFSGMKHFNGKFGFAEGDLLLKSFSEVLVGYFGSDSCSRFAQDHFAAIVDAADLDETLRNMLEDCKGMNDGKNLPVRVGVYLDQDDSVDVGSACDRAKYACRVQQQAYRSAFTYFEDSMLAAEKWRSYIIDNIDKAIDERWIQVYYQPIVRAGNGLVCDEEALARWNDPEHGFLTPADFVPILEDSKLAYKLDLFVVDEVLAKMKGLAEAGFHMVPQSVNLSRADFDACDIVEEVRRRVDENGIPRDKLTIEITESIIGSDFEFMRDQVNRFQDLGFSVWMDDFGSGYSSLDVLQRMHVDLIKFDMSFLQRFDEGDESKIILTELVKMAVGLGIDTLAEGVETEEHVAFLQEIGCNKLQGYYYCKPIPPEKIFERNKEGIQIGFEDPQESDYYATVGRVNLHDTSIMAQEDAEVFQRYFDTLPMAILETTEGSLAITRCNKPYRDFAREVYGIELANANTRYDFDFKSLKKSLLDALSQCSSDGRKIVIDERLGNGSTLHAFIKRIAFNPATGVTALVIVILAITGEETTGDGVTFAHIAEALSADYLDLYYVDLDTEQFVQYSSDADQNNLNIERHGDRFFQRSRDDAMRLLYEEDRDSFVESFTKERVLRSLDERGTFAIAYRLIIDGAPVYVNMKAVRMKSGSNRVIIGVSNIDSQVSQRKALERARAERITYSRITALAGDYLCIYTVNPETGHYVEYGATPNYEGLGLSKEGDDFFTESIHQSERVIFEEDRDMFRERFTREAVLDAIEKEGLFVLNYRLVMGGETKYMRVKAAIVEEDDGPQLVIGVIMVDAQVRLNWQFGRE